jgi:two-component system phosphate regulon response regulator OmpR
MAAMTTVLVVDDEPLVRDVVVRYLKREGFDTLEAADGDSARELIERGDPHLVVLDVMIPGTDGLALCRWIRSRGELPVIMLTARGEEGDRIAGLEIGADDYVTKPFDPRELLARIKSVLRRTSAAFSAEMGAERVRIGRCMLDRAAHRLTDEAGREVPMSPLEFTLLKALSDHPNRVLSRERILNFSGQSDWDPLDRSVDLRILRLRKKIEPDPEYPQYIRTVRSEGYMFVPGGSEEK